jgi:8-oxo-dGTP pyrophosphatase MutT (NUDIX family)
MDYLTKYLKYKQKYLKTKNQFGKGAACIHDRSIAPGVNYTHLRELPNDSSRLLPKTFLNHDEHVDVLEENNGYGKIIKNGVTGWCKMIYLKYINTEGKKVPCVLHPFKGAVATGGPAISGASGTSSYGCTHSVCQTESSITGVGAVIIVKHDGRRLVLLGEERSGSYKDQLNLIGGQMDKPGECPLVAIYRETAEESKILPIGSSNWAEFDAIFKLSKTIHTRRKNDTLIFFGVIEENPSSILTRLNTEITRANSNTSLPSELREMRKVVLVDPNNLSDTQDTISSYARSVITKNLDLINSL